MNWKVTETWRNTSRQTLMFRIKSSNDETEEVCGVTQIAINDYYKTEDSLEQAERNFEENKDFILNKAVYLISSGVKNDEGHYIVTSEIINASNIL